jgi:hypothetical protein
MIEAHFSGVADVKRRGMLETRGFRRACCEAD